MAKKQIPIRIVRKKEERKKEFIFLIEITKSGVVPKIILKK